MFFVLSKLLEFLLMPLTWIVTSFVIGLVLSGKGKKSRWMIAGVVMLLFFTNPFVVNKAISLWETPAYNKSAIAEQYDIGILLGGSMRYFNNDLKRPVYSPSVDRLLQTIELYHSKKIGKILLSGGSGRISFPNEKEAKVIKEVLLYSGVNEDDIILEIDSRNTFENALYSGRLLDSIAPNGTYLLITSAWHMRRSLGCFSKLGYHPVPFPVDERSGDGTLTPDRYLIPSSQNLFNWDMLLHEWFGCLAYKIMGYM